MGGLLRHYLPALRGFVRARMGADLRARESSSDVVQSVCRELCEDLPKLDFQSEPAFRAWLFTTAAHKLAEHARYHRRARRDPAREEPWSGSVRVLADDDVAGRHPSPSQEAVGNETAERLERAMASLPENYREVLALTRFAGLSQAEIAAHWSTTVMSVRKTLGRALRALSRELDESPPDPR